MIWQDYQLEGELYLHNIHSDALASNPLNDPSERDLYVYEPPEEYVREGCDFPVIYVLSGFGSRSAKYLKHGTFEPGLHVQYERVLKEGGGPGAVLVFPDCMTSLGGAQYMNSPAVGSYETYFVKEVTAAVQELHPVTNDPADHILFGKSSGGYGSMRLGMRHPDQFGAIFSHSGDCYFEYCYLPDLPGAVDEIVEAESAMDWVQSYREDPFRSGGDFPTFNIVAMSACYSPDPEQPGTFKLPFDPETGAFREEVWNQWKQHDPLELVDSHTDALEQLNTFYFDCGNRDEFNLHLGNRLLSDKLHNLDISHTYEEFDGGHRGTRGRYPYHLQLMTQYLEGQEV